MLYFIKSSFICLTKEIFVPVYSALARPHLERAIKANYRYLKKGIYHLEGIQRAATRWVKGFRGLNYEERINTLKLQSLEKRRIRNDLVLNHKFLDNQIDLEGTQLFMFSKRPGLRRSSPRLRQQTGRSRRRRKSFACRDVKYWSHLLLAATSELEQRVFKRQHESYIYS